MQVRTYEWYACMHVEEVCMDSNGWGGLLPNYYENQLGNVKSQLRNYTLDNLTEQSILNLGL